MANNQSTRRFEATLGPFMNVGDAPVCHQLHSIADSTYVVTTSETTDGRMSYIVRAHRRPSSHPRTKDLEDIAASSLHLLRKRRRRPMTSTLAFLPKTNTAAVRGSKAAYHLSSTVPTLRWRKHDGRSCRHPLMWSDGQLQYKSNQ